MIGDPATRYREDPVRILRAIRIAAKLGFTIDEKTKGRPKVRFRTSKSGIGMLMS